MYSHNDTTALSSSTSIFDNSRLHSTQSLSGRYSVMTYKNVQYTSATTALLAYIDDFEEKRCSPMYPRSVEDLLMPRSVLLQTVDRSLDTNVRDTEAEWRRYVLKKSLDASFSQISRADDLAHEKARALLESSRLLSKDLSPLPGSSVITEAESEVSMSTDALLSQPHSRKTRPPLQDRQRQTYSSSSWKNHEFKHQEQYSNKPPIGGREFSHSSYSIGNGHPNDWIEDVNANGISHLIGRSREHLTVRDPPSWVQGLDASGTTGLTARQPGGKAPPSWVQDLDASGTTGLTARHLTVRDPPSWVQDLDASGTTGLTARHLTVRDPPSWVKDLGASGTTGLTARHPGGKAPPSWVQDLDASRTSGLTARHPGGKAPPSWVQDLNTSDISSNVNCHSVKQNRTRRPLPTWIHDPNLTIESRPRGKLARQSKKSLPNLRRTHSSSELSNVDRAIGLTNGCKLPNAMITASNSYGLLPRNRDIATDEELSSNRATRQTKRTLQFGSMPKLRKTYSFTTDDLLMASPLGEDMPLLRGYETQGGQSVQASNRIRYPKYSKRLIRETQPLSLRPTASIGPQPWEEDADRGILLSSTPKHSERGGCLGHDRLNDKAWNRKRSTEQRVMFEREVQQHEDSLLENARRVLDAARMSKNEPRDEMASNHDDSLLTEEVLDASRPWERGVLNMKPLKRIQDSDNQAIVATFLDDSLKSTTKGERLTGGDQPGPVEALKNMLYTLQGMALDHPQALHPSSEQVVEGTVSSSQTRAGVF